MPHLIIPSISEAIEKAKAPVMYLCNLVSQPGETDGYSVSDHLKVLNNRLGSRKVDVVIANTGEVDLAVSDTYKNENKTIVPLDREVVEELGAEIIAEDIIRIDNGSIRHNELKTAYLVFSYFM